MKKGFTLVELLGTITILGVIMLIVAPIARNIISDSKEELYEVQVSNIEDALKNWVVDNSRLLPENEGETITITLGQLKAGGYVEAELRNPKNNKCFGNDMLLTVTRHQKNYIYNVEDESSTETTTCDEYLKPYIILNGDAIVYVEVGEGEYVDLGASAIGTDGADISPNITTSISGSGDTIDTSVVGNSYTITYTVIEGTTTTSIKRKVIVNDTIPPELIIPDNVILEAGDTSLNAMEGVTATDNSDSSGSSVNIAAKSNISFGIPGEYTITYIATDSSGNKIIKKRIVEIFKIEKTLAGLATTSIDLGITEVDSCVEKGTLCNFGAGVQEPTVFAIKVNVDDVYKFYVINDDGNEVTLIMDRNLGEKVAWYENEKNSSFGPITAVTALNERTRGWTNISKRKYTYADDGGGAVYESFTETMRARLLTYTEAENLGCKTTGSCPAFLYINLSSAGTEEQPLGYWTSAAHATITGEAWTIRTEKKLSNRNTHSLNYGIRPVITLSK